MLLKVLYELLLVVWEAGIIIGILYLLWRYRWRPWLYEGLMRAGETERAEKYAPRKR